ncbi:FliG C-terminal domain-containing protein [Spirochaeta dissipatitropha]
MKIYGRSAVKEPGQIKTYDFTRPDKFTRGQITTMSLIHERFARELSLFLSDFLRTEVSAGVKIVDQLCFEEFNDMVPEHPVISINSMSPLPRRQLLQIDQVLTNLTAEILGGGGISTTAFMRREASRLDCMLMQPVLTAAADLLQKCWWFVDGMRTAHENTETRIDHAQILPPTAMIIMVELAVSAKDTAGSIRLVYPFELLEPLLEKLNPLYWHRIHRQGYSPASSEQASRRSEMLEFDARFRLLLPEMSVAEVAELKPGSRIEIPDSLIAEISAGKTTVLSGEIDLTQKSLPEIAELGFEIPGKHYIQLVHEQLDSGFRILNSKMEAALERISAHASINPGLLIQDNEDTEIIPMESMDPDQVFSALTVEHIDSLQQRLGSEHSQSKAAILTLLGSPLAAEYLNRCSSEERKDIMARIMHSSSCSDHALHCYSRFLEPVIRTGRRHSPDQTGLEKAAEILSYAPRSIERELIEDWNVTEPQLSEELKKRLFVFEDIVILDPAALRKLLKHISYAELARACKSTDPIVLQYFEAVLPEDGFAEFNQQLSGLGPLRIRDVEAAQQRIVLIIKELTESGEIVIAREGEMTD